MNGRRTAPVSPSAWPAALATRAQDGSGQPPLKLSGGHAASPERKPHAPPAAAHRQASAPGARGACKLWDEDVALAEAQVKAGHTQANTPARAPNLPRVPIARRPSSLNLRPISERPLSALVGCLRDPASSRTHNHVAAQERAVWHESLSRVVFQGSQELQERRMLE